MKFLSPLLLSLTLTVLPTYSKVHYTSYDRNSCSKHSSTAGKSIFCCNGACKDGTTIGKPGQCELWTQHCKDGRSDLPQPPKCPRNKYLVKDGSDNIDAGLGNCSGNVCKWQRKRFKWKCCDCPLFYTDFNEGKCEKTKPSSPCVGCDEPGEYLLAVSVAPGGWTCVVSRNACEKDQFAECRETYRGKIGSREVWRCKGSNRLAGCPKPCFPEETCTNAGALPSSCWVSKSGLAEIKKFEGYCKTFYNRGDGVKRIGYGHNCKTHSPSCATDIGIPMTVCTAELLLRATVSSILNKQLSKLPNVNLLTQNQVDALTSLVYSCGSSAILSGPIYESMKAKKVGEVCENILKAGDAKCRSKDNEERRKKESRRCSGGSKTALGCKF